MTRIRIPINVPIPLAALIIAIAFILNFGGVQCAYGQAAPPPAPRLVFSEVNGYATTAVLSSVAGANFTLSNCVFGPLPETKIAANGTVVIPSPGASMCSYGGLGGIPITAAGVEGRSVITHVNGAHFAIPLLKYSLAATRTSAGQFLRLVNKGPEKTFLVLIADARTVAQLDVRDDQDKLKATEYVSLNAGLNFYALRTEISAGRVVIKQDANFGPIPEPTIVFGAAIIGPDHGATQIVEVMQP